MTQRNLNEIKQRAFTAQDSVAMEDVLTLIGYSGKTRKRGDNLFYQCINGCDPKGNLDKCSINVRRNLAHCFACGQGWGPAKLMAEGMGISFLDSCLILARNTGDITEDEYLACMDSAANHNKITSDSHVLQKIEHKKIEEQTEFKAPVDTIDLVYRHMLALPEFKLTHDSIRYLMNYRNLSVSEIERAMFFSYEKTFSVDTLVASVQSEKPDFSYKNLWGVPGFYFAFSDKNKTQGHWKFRRPYLNSIGIPLTNAEGQIVALQMRSMKSNLGPKDSKYFFVTSKGYSEKGLECAFGSSSGSPAHVEYPCEVTNSTIIIGEGKFKMMEAAKEGSISISCQGVANYRYAVDEISDVLVSKKLQSHLSPSLRNQKHPLNFLIAYDADMFGTYNVLVAAVSLKKSLSKHFANKPVSFLVWDKELAKGYDDLKFVCQKQGIDFKTKCFAVPGDVFLVQVGQAVRETDNMFNLQNCDAKNKNTIRSSKEYSDSLYQNLYQKRIAVLNPNM